MSYIVTTSKVKTNRYDILETKTQTHINVLLSKTEANKIARKLNLGGGFGDSQIPSFFVKTA